MMKKICILTASFLGFVAIGGLFTVNQIEQVVITRFGEPVRVLKEPGLCIKIPFLEESIWFDNRMQNIELQALEVTLGDKRRIIVDAFVRYKITDPLKFLKTVLNETGVINRVNPIVLGSLCSVLGGLTLNSLLSDARISVMNKIRDEVNKAAKDFGIEVIDVRIKKTDLPSQNSEAISKRMISEREREARELRAKGIEQAQIIKSEADKFNSIAVSEADTKASLMVAEAYAEANRICIDAYSKDKGFSEKFQKLDAYQSAFTDENTTFVLSEKGNFFSIMKNDE